ncbi:MAG: hypothetical protein CMJ38_03035 [Phycisphaerae bacterium]|nr:hypothetical protein [Phycisphaerae bacterium]
MHFIHTIQGLAVCLTLTQYTHAKDESMSAIAHALRTDARLVCIGDSLSTTFYNRIGTASLMAWPIERVTAIGGGAGLGSPIVSCYGHCSPVARVLASDQLGYTVERQTSKQQFFTLPVRGLKEIYGDDSFTAGSNGKLFEFNLNVDALQTSVSGPFLNTDDEMKFRYLYRAPSHSDLHINNLSLRDNGSHVMTFSPEQFARKLWHYGDEPDGLGRSAVPKQINACASDIPANNHLHATARVVVAEYTPIQHTNRYVQVAGGIYYKTDEASSPKEGLYFSSLSDDSWSYSGFCSDTEGQDTHDKQFSLEQFTHWLDVTTLRREQPVVFLWQFGIESIPQSVVRARYELMIEQADAGAKAIGIEQTFHLLITPYMMKVGNSAGKEAHQYLQEHQTVCEEIAQEQSHVGAISIYEATEGVLFIGTNSANDWLLERGFNAFDCGSETIALCDAHFGNFLDGAIIHPAHADGAKFFAAIIGNEIRRKACHADLVPDGTIGITDVLEAISSWGTPEGDVTGDGETNVSDILEMINTWGDCWPVQAPFNGQFE